MTFTPKILAFAGSARRDSYNKKLVTVAAQLARDAGAEVRHIDLRDLPLPLMDEDLEKERGLPENARTLKQWMAESHGFLISTPEYNSSIPPLLKNVIDWASRRASGEPVLAAFKDKVAGVIAASPGALGGTRVLPQVRTILSNIGVVIVPATFGLSKANEAFDDKGALKDPRHVESVRKVVEQLVTMTVKLHRPG